jgi:murein DD-endopeptidase MepM/ murein hydrolase activator NlpD
MSRRNARRRTDALAIVLCGLVVGPAPALASDYSLPLDSLHYNQYITAYFDLGGNQDWNCGSTTYGGHRGTDIGIGGFGPMAEGRPVLAAADGEVVSTHDGEPDMCTSGTCGGGSGYGNHVVVQHADGKRTIYAHFKTFTVLVQPGQSVACGQPLGEVGSSGNSTGPHLHFETRAEAAYATADDPFSGPCGGPVSWWLSQGGYQSLPELSCTDFVDPWPVLTLDAEVAEIDGAAPDLDMPHAPVGATIVQRFFVHNTGHPLADGYAQGLRVGFEIDAPLRVVDWWVEHSCADDLCPSPADDDPANPHPDVIDDGFELELGSLAPGVLTRVSVALVGESASGDALAHTRFFVAHVDDAYAKASWGAAFDDPSGRQTWNDGDLRLELAVSIGSSDENDSGDSAEGGGDDSSSTSGPSPGHGEGQGEETDAGSGGALPDAYGHAQDEGCSCGAGTTPERGLLSLVLLLLVRRSRARG